MLVLILGTAAAFVIRAYLHAGSTEVAVESIAVIPFENQNNDPAADWISDGLTESIINNLAQLPNLKVIARSSVFRYKGRTDDPLSIGREIAWLQRGYDERDFRMTMISVSFEFDSVRSDPRFVELVQKIGLPQ